jgi:hypothetical protein
MSQFHAKGLVALAPSFALPDGLVNSTNPWTVLVYERKRNKGVKLPKQKTIANNDENYVVSSANLAPHQALVRSEDPTVGVDDNTKRLHVHKYFRGFNRGKLKWTDAESVASHLLRLSTNGEVSRGEKLNKDSEELLRFLLIIFIAELIPRLKGRKKDNDYNLVPHLLRSIRDLRKTLTQFAGNENQMEDFVKYHHSILVCRIARSEEFPPVPKSLTHLTSLPNLYTGYMRKIIYRSTNKYSSVRNISFIQSLFNVKRMFRELCLERDFESLQDHENLLTAEDKIPLGELPFCEYLDEVDLVRRQIEKTSEEIFLLTNVPRPTKLLPTFHACFQSGTKDGGTQGIFEKVKLDHKMFSFEAEILPEDKFGPDEKIQDPFLKPNKNQRILELLSEANMIRQSLYEQAYKNSFGRDEEIKKVMVKLVKEPGKNRPITMCDGFLNTVVQPAQKQLLDMWSKTPYSTMLGDLGDKMQFLYARSPRGWLWCSADYKSATDTIKMWATKACLDPLKHLPDFELLQKSIAPSVIVYPEFKKKKRKIIPEHEVIQTNGQLMGSPLSFPFLCCINLSIFRHTVSQWVEKTHRFDDAKILWDNLLINGDDLVFRAPKDFISFFYEKIGLVGFVPSIGKNYVSAKYATINSKVFTTKFSMRGKNMVQCGYLNLPIIFGKILHEGDIPPSPSDIGLGLTDMFDHCSFSKYCLRSVINPWKKVFFPGFRPNPFVPAFLGGYGIDPRHRPEGEYQVTTQHLRIATAMVRPGSKLKLFSRMSCCLPKSTKLLSLLSKFLGKWKILPFSEITPDYTPIDQDKMMPSVMQYIRLKMVGQNSSANDPSVKSIVSREAALKQIRGIKIGEVLTKLKNSKTGEQRLTRERFEDYVKGGEFVESTFDIPPNREISCHGMNTKEIFKFQLETRDKRMLDPSYGYCNHTVPLKERIISEDLIENFRRVCWFNQLPFADMF